jgi:tetratricopeptide (TPR) repeat protein
MAKAKFSDAINDLFRQGEWGVARKRLERERAKDPDNHWVLTQLGVTFYEQRQYKEALRLFQASLKIVPDCPLTLWNLAGTLDALGQCAGAIQIYTWLLKSRNSPADDPCWESKEWTDALKTDCIYRLGVCFEHVGRREAAEHCYRQYVELSYHGIDGSYPIEDAKRHIQGLHRADKQNNTESQLRKAVRSMHEVFDEPQKGHRQRKLNFEKLLAGCQVA